LALGLSQAELALTLDVTPWTIKRLEKLDDVPRLYDLALQTLERRAGWRRLAPLADRLVRQP
jgi:hypothetical protein